MWKERCRQGMEKNFLLWMTSMAFSCPAYRASAAYGASGRASHERSSQVGVVRIEGSNVRAIAIDMIESINS